MYKNRIGSLDDEQAVKNEGVDDLNGNNHDSDLDSMYAEEKKVLGSDDGDEGRNDLDMYGGSNGGNDEDGNGTNTNNEEGWGDGEDGNGANINNEEGGHDEDGNSAKINGNEVGNDGINPKIKGGCSLPGGKDNGGSTKRKLEVTQDDEGSTRTKKTKKNGSGGIRGPPNRRRK